MSCRNLSALALALALTLTFSASAADESLTVDFGEAPATATITPEPTTPPTPTATATPTAEPTQAPSPAVPAAKAPAEPAAQKLDMDSLEGDEGVVIIAPGSMSPEDSLAAFGIESPFEGAKARRGALVEVEEGNREEGTGEAVELSAPEASDFKDNVSLVTADGRSLKSLENFVHVEDAGALADEDELRADGLIGLEKNNRGIIAPGMAVYLRMEEGRQVSPGAEYTSYRVGANVDHPETGTRLGVLTTASGVLKVIRVDAAYVQARVVKVYCEIRPGDRIRLRDRDKLKYLNSLRRSPKDLAGDLTGTLVAFKNNLGLGNQGDIAYLDFGRAQGVVPGTRFTVYRPVEDKEAKDEETGRTGQMANTDPLYVVNSVGTLGVVEVVSTNRQTCAARIVKAGSPLKAGDRLRFR